MEDVKDLSKEKLLGMMGFRRSSAARRWLGASALFGAGLLVGAGLALLVAPHTGREVRKTIAHRFRRMKRRSSVAAAVLPLRH
jgi:hypothetical protein